MRGTLLAHPKTIQRHLTTLKWIIGQAQDCKRTDF
jgi:hypothetical protein